MAWLQSGTPWTATGSSMTVTVPVGVVPAHTVLLHAGGSVTAPSSVTATASGATFTSFVPIRTDGSSWTAIIKGTGLTAGQVITVATSGSSLNIVSHHYFDKDFTVPGPIANRGGATSASVTAPALTVPTGSTVYVLATDRTASVTTVTSLTNSLGLTVSNLYYQRAPAASNTGTFLGSITVPGTTTGTTTITLSGTSANANAFHVVETIPVPSVSVALTSGFGVDYLRGGWVVSSGTNFRMVVSTSPTLTSPVYSTSAPIPLSRWITAKVTGLTPGTTYYIGLEIDGVLLPTGRLSASTLQHTVLSYVALTSSCQSTGSNHVVFDQMASENAAFFAHQGDLHYADADTEGPWRTAFISSMSSARMAGFVAHTPMSYVFDNHDWAGQGRDASAWNPSLNPATMVREVAGDFPATSTNEIYHTWVHGRVRWIKLDQWSTRDPDAATNTPTKHMISAEQEQWLYDTLGAATEPLIIFLSSWPMYRNLGAGRWGSYPDQNGRIKSWLASRPHILKRMVAIGGDSHAVHADSGANQDTFGLMPTLNASPLNQSGGLPSGTWDIGNIDVPSANGYYSRVTITDTTANITMKWDAVQDDGVVVMTYSKTLPNYAAYSEWDGTTENPLLLEGVWNGTAVDPANFDEVV